MIPLTALILTYNEKENIGRAIAALSWVEDILIIDSGSTDGTTDLAFREYANVQVIVREFDSFAAQCNFGLSQIATEWVLSLDSDYLVSAELSSEIAALVPPSDVAGYSAEFRYCIFGHPLRSSVYPPRTVLYRRRLARYRDEGHGHRVVIDGIVKRLSGKIDHDDRKPFSQWLRSQDKYARIEARYLLSQPPAALSVQDRLRRQIFFAPATMFLYLVFFRELIFDGWPGWFYVCQRTIAELLLSVRLLIEREKLELHDGVKS